jgi:transcriptional regulator with XRE-family HTH domain
VGRTARPADPRSGDVARFASELRALRESAGLSPAAVESRSGVARSTLYAAYKGDALPNWTTVERLVRACRGNPDEWLPRWEAAAAARPRRAEPSAAAAPAPGEEPGLPAAQPHAEQAVHPENHRGHGPDVHQDAAPPPAAAAAEVAAAPVSPAGSTPAVVRPQRLALRVLLALAVVVVLAALVRPDTPDATSPSLLYARDDALVPIRSCPSLRCEVLVHKPSGSDVRMICFRDAEIADINYRSERWFNVAAARDHGWVHSSQVGRQTRVGLC